MKKILVALVFFLLFIVAAEFLGVTWSHSSTFTSCQPAEINYKSFDPYCLNVVKLQRTLSSNYIILVSKKVDPDYGAVVSYPDQNILGREEFEKLKVTWSNDGIEIVTLLNVKLFIDQKQFTGGR